MKPFEKKYVIDKIIEYNSKIKVDKINDYEIKRIDGLQGTIQGYLYKEKADFSYPILELHGEQNLWMRLTPLEIQASYFPISRAWGKVGVVGLGLGYAVEEIAQKAEVTEVIVYEISKEVIELYKNNFGNNSKIKIIQGDAYKAKSESFDFFYVDIYQYKVTSQVVEDYREFKYLHKIEEYTFFGMEHFLLSCTYDEIVWVYIPEMWMEMAREAYEALQESELLPYYEQLDKNIVSQVLARFKAAFEEID